MHIVLFLTENVGLRSQTKHGCRKRLLWAVLNSFIHITGWTNNWQPRLRKGAMHTYKRVLVTPYERAIKKYTNHCSFVSLSLTASHLTQPFVNLVFSRCFCTLHTNPCTRPTPGSLCRRRGPTTRKCRTYTTNSAAYMQVKYHRGTSHINISSSQQVRVWAHSYVTDALILTCWWRCFCSNGVGARRISWKRHAGAAQKGHIEQHYHRVLDW